MKSTEIINDNLDYTLFSWSQQKNINPIAIERAEGVYMFDYDGKRYLDFSSGLMNVNIGHGNQRVTNAVMKQNAGGELRNAIVHNESTR